MNKEDTEIDYIKDYLRHHGLKSTLECLEKEETYRHIADKRRESTNVDADKTKLSKLILENKEKSKQIAKNQENYKILDKKHKSVLQCARQIFSIVINCLQQYLATICVDYYWALIQT